MIGSTMQCTAQIAENQIPSRSSFAWVRVVPSSQPSACIGAGGTGGVSVYRDEDVSRFQTHWPSILSGVNTYKLTV